MNTSVAQRAAAWWANHLRSTPVMNNGDAEQSLMLSLFAGMTPRLSSEEIARFEQALAAGLAEQRDFFSISYDYDPDATLLNAARRADVDLTSQLPVKTQMQIDGEKITVLVGYGAREEIA